ncbi:MAG: fibronectin type III domain-containing protein [Armatimonadetes bacterium]|nr:fibronectin type III domain-containing protein [Armatimonadota bacterium]
MATITSKLTEFAFLEKGKVLVSNAAMNAGTLGLSAAQVAELQAKAVAFESEWHAVAAKKAELASAVSSKNEVREAFETLVRNYAAQWRGTADLDDSLLATLFLAPHTTPRTKSQPTQPMALIATPDAQGTVKLRWQINGNIPRTVYVIEMNLSDGRGWTMVGTTTAKKYTHLGNPVAQPALFRIVATRRGLRSAPSDSSAVFDSGVQPEKAAA